MMKRGGPLTILSRPAALPLLLLASPLTAATWYIPVRTLNRQDWSTVRLTSIGAFGIRRKARPKIPSHLHTGVDIARPSKDYEGEEPIYPAAPGKVVSMRDDGPFGEIILEHELEGVKVWTAYEHLVGIRIKTGDSVRPDMPMGRYMNRKELQKFGWQFDHVHFEVLKVEPRAFPKRASLPYCSLATYDLLCFDAKSLTTHYWNPADFFSGRLAQEKPRN